MKKVALKILILCMAICSALCVFTACGETEEKHEHSYTSSYVEPTCEEQGGTKYVCSCGDVYWEDVVPALGHNPSAEWTVDKQATCTETGIKSHHCLTCGKHLDETEILLLPHNIEDDGVCTMCHQRFSAEGLTYALNNTETEYSVTGIGTFKGAALYVPQTYNNLPVTGIAAYAFNQQTQLTSVNIPKSINSIDDYAFNGCVNITRIEFDASSCQDFEENNNVFSYVGQSQNGTTVVIGKNVVKIPAYFLYSNTKENAAPKVKEINFDNAASLKRINKYAFAGCTALKSLNISDNVTTIEYGAFYGCSYLQDITLPFIGEQQTYSQYDNPIYMTFCYIFSPLEFNGYTLIGGYGTGYVPSSLKTVTVTDYEPMASAFSGCTDIENVVIKNAEKINDTLFYGCSSLKSVEIPDTVKEIGSSAFYGCSKLETFVFPTELRVIKGSAFARCSHLAELNFNNKLEEIEGSAFERCLAIKEIVLPSSLNKIGAETFKGCLYIEKITLDFIGTEREITGDYGSKNLFGAIFSNSNVEYDYTKQEDEQPEFHTYKIMQRYSDGNFAEFWLPNTLTTVIYNGRKLNYGAFSGFADIIEIILCDNLKEIGAYVFSDCSSLTSIVIPDSVTSIGDRAFNYCSSLTSVTIPDSVTSIGSSAFSGCSSLTGITIPFVGATKNGTSNTHFGYIFGASSYSSNYPYIPSTLKIVTITGSNSIGTGAFYGCSGLTSITIPDGVKSIGNNAFSGCRSLTNITIPDGVTSIGTGAFFGCRSLTNITIPDGVTSIGGYAFSGCRSLTNITIPDSVTSIQGLAFSNCSCLTSIEVSDNNRAYKSIDGNLYSKDGKTFIQYPGGKTSTAFTIPDSVTSIGNYAFYDCSCLTSITIPDSVTSIGTGAFYDCSGLTSITIPDGVKSIGNDAFSNCSCLTSITIPNSVTSIGNYAFSDCSGLTSITIPDGVTSIGTGAFKGCRSLTNITIPDGVTSIGRDAFYNCSSLTGVMFKNTSGWRVSTSSTATSGTSVTIPNASTAATYLKSTYCDYYWKCS